MTERFRLEEKHLKIFKEILKKYPYTFYVFGSRVKGTEKRLSDIDLCVIEDIPGNILSHLEEDFEESNLPFTVDIVQWKYTTDSFKKLIEKDLTLIQTGEKNIIL